LPAGSEGITYLAGSDVVEIATTVTTVRLSCACAEAGPDCAAEESVVCTAKLKVPETVGSPVITPELLRVCLNDPVPQSRSIGKSPDAAGLRLRPQGRRLA
ncbi:MAG: hypothetical protein ACLPKT_17945, partial [Methylocella sp.]